MAGAGKKTFTAGETLTASDVNTYLMEQSVMVFGGTAARSSAIPTPSDGMVTYNQTNNSLEAYNGTEWINKSGLQLVKKQTIGTAVSSVTVTGAFSATYENYKIIVTGGTASTAGNFGLRLGATTAGYFTSLIYTTFGGSSINVLNSSTSTNYSWAGGSNTAASWMNCDVHAPFINAYTRFSGPYTDFAAAGNIGNGVGFLPNTTSYTEFTLVPAAGTLSSGTIYVYGYGT
jgi:hypothetical protein